MPDNSYIIRDCIRFLAFILLFSSCNGKKRGASDEMPSLHAPPLTVRLNLEEGYIINTATGDSIDPVINSLGDTIKTGVPIPVKGKTIHPDSLGKPIIIPAQESSPLPFRNNVKITPENITIIPIDKDKLKIFTPGVDAPSNMLVYPSGDTFPTGIPIPIKGKVIRFEQPKPVNALPPSRGHARINIKYLNEAHGLKHSHVFSILMDSRGNLWFGTWGGGVSKYNGRTFTHFSERQGLSRDVVSIVEDRKGNIWFGTLDKGVYMYNGETLTHFSHDEGLINANILCMMVDSHDDLWFGTEGGGAARYDGKTILHFTTKEGLPDNNVLSMMEDSQGNLWFGTRGGACKYDGEIFTHLGKREGLRNTITSIHEDREDNIWFGTDRGVFKYAGDILIHFTEIDGFSYSSVSCIYEDSHGDLWFGAQGSSIRIYSGGTFTQLSPREGLNCDHINSILEDRQGNMWIGTNAGGVNILSHIHFTYLHYSDGLSYNAIPSISEDSQGNLWFGTANGLSKYNEESFTNYYIRHGLSDNWINSILEDSQGNLWFGTKYGGLNKYNGKTFTHFTVENGLSHNWVWSILEDGQKDLWIATNGGGVSRYNGVTFEHYTEKEGFSNNYIRSVAEDSQGNIWFGTYGGGVIKYNRDTITHISENEGLGSNFVICIREDSYGNLWFGTDDRGVSIFNGETFLHITEQEGLSDNCAWSIMEDNHCNIWVGTRNGLNYLDLGSCNVFRTTWGVFTSEMEENGTEAAFYQPVIHTYGLQDGLKQRLLSERCLYLDSKNRIWSGNEGIGLFMLDMNNFKIPVEPPKMQLDWIEINEQFADYRKLKDSAGLSMEFSDVARFRNYPVDLELPYHNNHLTFHFSAIDWAAPHKLRYSYKMDGIDDNWSLPIEEAVADYRNMPSGTFTFIVRAIGTAQKWSEPFEYTFTIKPPWWRAWWAIIIDCLLAISLLIAIIRFRERNLKQRAVMLEQQVEDKTHQILEQRKEVDEMKSRFYTNISHEFRTPLTLLISPIEDAMKQGQEKTEVSKKILGIMHRNARRLQNLINQLLDISRIESGKMELQLSKANLSEFVRVVASSFYSLAESRQIQYQIDIEPGGEDSCFDADKTEKILTNLLSNAFKFSEEGGSVSLHLEFVGSVDENQRQAVIRVADTGKGMEQDQLERIFDRFYQVSDTDTRQVEGSGIGLTLTRELLELMHGSIEVESAPGKGTIFIVTFPVSEISFSEQELRTFKEGEPQAKEVAEDEPEQLRHSESETEIQGQEVVLVVEDNPDLRSYIIEKLSSQYKIIEAENGETGLHKAIEQIPDLVISDLMMPVMDGMEMCGMIKEDVRTSHIPVIMLTAKADRDSRLKGLKIGADDYIVKPFDAEELQVRVDNLIEQRKRLRERYREEFLTDSAKSYLAPTEKEFLQKMIENIQQHISEPEYNVDQLGKDMGFSRMHLYRKILALTDHSPVEYLRNIRLKFAARLFQEGHKNVAQVMYQAGFNTPSHFAQCFRQLYGMNPSDYIKSLSIS